MSKEVMLKVENLSLMLGKDKILNNVSFEIPKSSVCAFLGSNGAGKTTTIKCIMGLYPYKDGTITINNINGKDALSHYCVSYVPEKENFPNIKVKRFLDSLCSYYHLDQEKTRTLTNNVYKLFNIEGFEDHKLTKLSSGQKKKILVMQALLNNSDLLIMDEPTENMDPDTRKIFYDIIEVLKHQGKTIFISTHNLDEIQKHTDHVIIIKSGEIKYTGKSTDEDLHKMYEKYTDHKAIKEEQKLQTKLTAKEVFSL